MKLIALFIAYILIANAGAANSGTNIQEVEVKPIKGILYPEEPMAPYEKSTFLEYYHQRIKASSIPYSMDIKDKSVEELVMLRNVPYARKGMLFTNPIIRGFFNSKQWYQPPFWEEKYPIKLDAKENQWIQKVTQVEKVKLKNNIISVNGEKIYNVKNAINLSQFKNLSPQLIRQLSQSGFSLSSSEAEQLFHIYEQNDYQSIPSWITPDLFLQAYHMYIKSSLKEIETATLAKSLNEFFTLLHKKAVLQSQSSLKLKQIQPDWYFIQDFAALGKRLMDGKVLAVHNQQEHNIEWGKLNQAQEFSSTFLNDKFMDYTRFQVRGHYTSTPILSGYFKAMQWLNAPHFCTSDSLSFSRILSMAWLIKEDTTLFKKINSINQISEIFFGMPDDYSLLDLTQVLKAKYSQVPLESLLMNKEELLNQMRTLSLAQNKVKPQIQMSCPDVISLFSQKSTPDATILTKTIDLDKAIPSRPVPSALDVFAAFGDTLAQKIIVGNAQNTWPTFPILIDSLRNTIGKTELQGTLYLNWLGLLQTLRSPLQEKSPIPMQHSLWSRKNLQTSLASWTELKHSSLLYVKQSTGAECGGWGPEPPVPIVMVEPNLGFWNAYHNNLNQMILLWKKTGTYSKRVKENSIELLSLVEEVLKAAQINAQGKNLTNKQSFSLSTIGSSIEYLTTRFIGSSGGRGGWEYVEDPDRNVALVTDIYTNNDNVLHAAVGPVQTLWVLAEKGGYIHLFRGAVLSYREFLEPRTSRLTDIKWQEMLKNKQDPGILPWLKPLFSEMPEPIVPSEYSMGSGCQ
jgi:hypothetical protein